MDQIDNLNLRFIRVEKGDSTERTMIGETIKLGTGQISVERQNHYKSNFRDRPRYDNNYRGGNFRGNARQYQNFERQNNRREYRNNYRDDDYSSK